MGSQSKLIPDYIEIPIDTTTSKAEVVTTTIADGASFHEVGLDR